MGQHSGARAAWVADGCSDGDLPCGCTHSATSAPTEPWCDLQTAEVCVTGKTAALVFFLLLQLSSLQPGRHLCRVPGCAQVTAPCTGEIMTGMYRFQEHAAPPGCSSAFKERADIWASWPLSAWGRIPKYTISPAKRLQPGGHQDIAW